VDGDSPSAGDKTDDGIRRYGPAALCQYGKQLIDPDDEYISLKF
jgi:hypothetical protein